MSPRRVRPARLLLVALLAGTLLVGTLLVTACGSGNGPAVPSAPPLPAEDAGPLKGPLVVFAATPLTAAKLVGTPAVFARDKLRIAMSKGNPKGVRALGDLAKPGVKLAVLDAGTPGGPDTRRLFDSQSLTVTPSSAPLEAKDAVAAIGSGEADAAVLYATDVNAAAASITGVAIPDRQNIVSSYRIAVLKAAKNPEAAQAYVDWLVNGPGQKLVTDHGFLMP